MDALMAALLDLLHELEGNDIPITIGGGFGLYLKRQHLTESRQRTLFDQLPESRATNDLDVFLRVEVLADIARTRLVSEGMRRIGYEPIPTAKFMQWRKDVLIRDVKQALKIDILVGPLDQRISDVHADTRRVRPKQKIEFHARRTEEAMHIEDEAIPITVVGARSTGDAKSGTIWLPHAFTYLIMKLHAFDDRKEDIDKALGRHHALDLYTIVGIMTEPEYERCKQLCARRAGHTHFERARAIVRQHFTAMTAMGLLRIREHALYRNEFLLSDFIDVLRELFQIQS